MTATASCLVGGSSAAIVDQCTGDWFVLRTKARQEKCLADTLTAMGIGHYLPLVRQVRYYGRRRATIETPMFPGYLFLRGSLDEAYVADRTDRVVQIIRVIDQQHISWELRNLYLAASRDAQLQPFAYLREGTRVEVRAGPFRGLQGIITRSAGSNRLILQITTLGQAVSLEIDGSLLDPIE